MESFAYVAFILHREEPSGERLLRHPSWRLFLWPVEAVERRFVEAHQRHLLHFQAAGSVIRIRFPVESIEEYAHAIVAGAA
jgi:hypothetical protein